MKKTKICTLDVEQSIINFLNNDFDVFKGSMGQKIDVSINANRRNESRLLLNYCFPDNLHEYDILIQDMSSDSIIPYSEKDNTREYITGQNAFYFISSYPETLFNPKSFASSFLSKKLKEGREKPILKIIFQSKISYNKYLIRNLADYFDCKQFQYSSYEHLINFCSSNIDICGKKVKLCENKFSKKIFESIIDECSYEQVFEKPKIWEGSKHIFDSNFIPLLETSTGYVVSYIYESDNDVTIMLPQCQNKVELLKKVFLEFLYPNYSEYFPTIKASSWKYKNEYYLPNQQYLHLKENDLKEKYKRDLAAIEQEKLENEKCYSYLHALLTESGDSLVEAVIKFLKWLGFTNVMNHDTIRKESDLFEEDIQIDLGEKGLLVIEVKGINGTSTDSECSQIHKIKFRRCEERGRFDVKAIYIVNNQRNVEPLKRTIPPFNEQQIKDATIDKRGLIYTWQLFNLYFNIENGFISKEEARNNMEGIGLINFTPQRLIHIGKPYKYYKNNTIVCLKIENKNIKSGDYFAYAKNERWYKVRILSIEEGGEAVLETFYGNYGFKLEESIPKEELFLYKY